MCEHESYGRMTDEQEHTFVAIAQMGVACGLDHRYEWLSNYLFHVINTIPYYERDDARERAISAFAQFERETASCPEEDRELGSMTDEQYIERVDAWYKRQREQHGS